MDAVSARALIDALIQREVSLIWQVGGVKRVLDPKMAVPDRVLVLLYATPGAVDVNELRRWTEYKNPSRFREEVLQTLHEATLIITTRCWASRPFRRSVSGRWRRDYSPSS